MYKKARNTKQENQLDLGSICFLNLSFPYSPMLYLPGKKNIWLTETIQLKEKNASSVTSKTKFDSLKSPF